MSKYVFTSCLYDPEEKGFADKIAKSIKEFGEFKKDRGYYERIFRWVVYVYDRQSPMVKEIPDLMMRKGEAAALAGYTTDEEGRFEEEVEKFLLGKDDDVNGLVVAYVSRFADPSYILLVASWNMLLDNTRKVLSGKQQKDTYATIKLITADIDDLTRTVFSSNNDNESIEMKKALYSRVEGDRLKLNHENIIKYVEEHGDLPSGFSPYGEKYKVEKLKFIGDGTRQTEEES